MKGIYLRSTVARMKPPPWVVDDLNSATGRGVRIGVIDSGWDRTQLDSRVIGGAGFVDSEDELRPLESAIDDDRIGHGTACTDLILKVAPGVEICPLRVFGRRLESSVSTIAEAVRWAVHRGVRVVNMSLGTMLPEALDPLYLACEFAHRHGIVLVAAKHNAKGRSFPAVFDNVIGVHAGDFESPFDYIYRGGEDAECTAKGVKQEVLWLNGCRVRMSGSSFAAPNICGIVALFLERYPDANLNEIRNLLGRYSLRKKTKGLPDQIVG
jgi:subtilisin